MILASAPGVAEPFNAQVAYLDIAMRFARTACPDYRVDDAAWQRAVRGSGLSERQLVDPPADTGLLHRRSGLLANPARGCREIWRDFGTVGFLAPGLLSRPLAVKGETPDPNAPR